MENEENVEVEVNPGPIEQGLLSEQANHRSTLIWTASSSIREKSLEVRRFDSHFWNLYKSSSIAVKELIDLAGFGGVARAGYYTLDHGLVIALVERWRSETHTFHLTCGEATITLEDVAILWGLLIDGEAITGRNCNKSKNMWQDLCQRLLGFRPVVEDIEGNKLKVRHLHEYLSIPLLVDATEDANVQRACGLLLMLFGGLLFSDRSGNKVSLRYLLHLEDFKVYGILNWGSGVLAYLYRCMCVASKGEAKEICGPLVLLQLWAWERIPILRPIRLVQELPTLPDQASYGARWDVLIRPQKSYSAPYRVCNTRYRAA